MMASFFAGTPLEARISLRKVKKSLAMSLAVGVALKKVLTHGRSGLGIPTFR
jgi:hypothetical protein